MDGRKNNGGHSTKGVAGRKSKDEEQKIAEILSPLEPLFLECVKRGLEDDQGWAARLYVEYKHGKAKETKDITVFQEQPIFNFDLD